MCIFLTILRKGKKHCVVYMLLFLRHAGVGRVDQGWILESSVILSNDVADMCNRESVWE